jgi:F0F1-type ATP synthase membrane subunit b/b'
MADITIFLGVFLLLDVFVMGLLTSLAIRHGYAHFRPLKHDAEKSNLAAMNETLPPALKEHLLKSSQEQFQTMLNHSVDQLHQNLESTSEQINNLIKRLATEVVSDELAHYRQDLAKLHEQAEKDFGGIKKEMDDHQVELKARAAQEIETEKQRLIKQIDTKLADAVGSFLTETLQHNVDLGSQASYLLEVLEEHKADFMKEVADETQSPS